MSTKRYLEKDGPVDPFFEIYKGVSTEHIFAYIKDGEINIQVDFYHPDPPESFDPDEWEAHSCYLTGPPTRYVWGVMWTVARFIQRNEFGRFHNANGRTMKIIAKDGNLYTFSESVERRAA